MKKTIIWFFIYSLWAFRHATLLALNVLFSFLSLSAMKIVMVNGQFMVSREISYNSLAYFSWSLFIYFLINALIDVRSITSLWDVSKWLLVSSLGCITPLLFGGKIAAAYLLLLLPYVITCFTLKYNVDKFNIWLLANYSLGQQKT